jgi:hypothetical protein
MAPAKKPGSHAKAPSTKHQIQSSDQHALLSIIPYDIFSPFKILPVCRSVRLAPIIEELIE